MDALALLDVDDGQVTLRPPRAGDVPAIAATLAPDQLGAARDGVTTPDALARAPRALRPLDADPAHRPQAPVRADRLRGARPRAARHRRGRAAAGRRDLRQGVGRPALVPVHALRLAAGAAPAGAAIAEVPAVPGRDHAAAAGQTAA